MLICIRLAYVRGIACVKPDSHLFDVLCCDASKGYWFHTFSIEPILILTFNIINKCKKTVYFKLTSLFTFNK